MLHGDKHNSTIEIPRGPVISKKELSGPLKSRSNIEHSIQTTLFCVMNMSSYTLIT